MILTKNDCHWEQMSLDKIARIKAMAGSIAHELRTPLSTVAMNIGIIKEILAKPIKGNISSVRENIENIQKKVVWKRSKDFIFSGNVLLMQHVIFNLLKNALFQITSVGKGTIELGTEQKGQNCWFHFKDTANGVSKDVLHQLFEKFFTHTKDGTGLGLAFCRMAIEAFGGTISCNSKEGEYMEFIIKLPKFKLRIQKQNKSILIIEDDQTIQAFYKMVLSDDYQITLVGTGNEAMKQMGQQHDAILLDIALPDISGIDLAKKIRLTNKDVPIICISAQGDNKERHRSKMR